MISHLCIDCNKAAPEVEFYNNSYVKGGQVVACPMSRCKMCLKLYRYRRLQAKEARRRLEIA